MSRVTLWCFVGSDCFVKCIYHLDNSSICFNCQSHFWLLVGSDRQCNVTLLSCPGQLKTSQMPAFPCFWDIIKQAHLKMKPHSSPGSSQILQTWNQTEQLQEELLWARHLLELPYLALQKRNNPIFQEPPLLPSLITSESSFLILGATWLLTAMSLVQTYIWEANFLGARHRALDYWLVLYIYKKKHELCCSGGDLGTFWCDLGVQGSLMHKLNGLPSPHFHTWSVRYWLNAWMP